MQYTAIQVEIQKLEKEIQAENMLLQDAMKEDKLFGETKEIRTRIHKLQDDLQVLRSKMVGSEG